jgi:hypothetical protein
MHSVHVPAFLAGHPFVLSVVAPAFALLPARAITLAAGPRIGVRSCRRDRRNSGRKKQPDRHREDPLPDRSHRFSSLLVSSNDPSMSVTGRGFPAFRPWTSPSQSGTLVAGDIDMVQISVDRGKIAAFCRRNRIRRLAFFGSVLREDFRPDSDIDVLVEFEPDSAPGFLGLAALEHELSSLLDGRKVDMRTAGELSRYFREEVVSSAEIQYAQG